MEAAFTLETPADLVKFELGFDGLVVLGIDVKVQGLSKETPIILSSNSKGTTHYGKFESEGNSLSAQETSKKVTLEESTARKGLKTKTKTHPCKIETKI